VTRKSGLIGLIVPDISHSFFAEITRGIQDVLEQHEYNLVLCNTNRDPQTEIREIEALRSAHVDGLLIASDQPEDNWRYFAVMAEQGQHFVLIDRYFDRLGAPHVGTDDFQTGKLATEHLIQLGHVAIAHVRGPAIRPARLRLKGYHEALRRHKLKTHETWLVDGYFQMTESREAARFLMCLRERPTGIVAGNDNSAFGVIRGCREAGYRVPDDVSVIGIGNVEGDQHPNPFLTTVHWDRMEMGREAARILLAGIAGEPLKPPARGVFAPSLLIRQSTAPPPRPK
jgi:LacI family transcriptional regulator